MAAMGNDTHTLTDSPIGKLADVGHDWGPFPKKPLDGPSRNAYVNSHRGPLKRFNGPGGAL
ncbi:hypothetical protein GCM10023259_000250 [Thermocatellispora tengchongensis]